MQTAFCQDIKEINDIKPFMFDLPLNSSKNEIIKIAREKFKKLNIDSFIVEANTKIYLRDTTISYDFLANKPLLTTIKIFELWSFDNPKLKDTTFYISIDAFYGTNDKAQKIMLSEYENLKDLFDDRFMKQKPYGMFADGKIAEGLNYFLNKGDKSSPFSVGWSNGGCFRNYRINISYRKK